MKHSKTFGIVLIVVGAIMLFFSNYIAEQVASGRLEISSAQRQVNAANKAFSQSQYTKPFGSLFTGSAQNKINAGQSEVDKYEQISNNLKIGGIILIVIGAGLIFFGRKKR